MPEITAPDNSLVLYKTHPARVQRADDRVTLELEGGETVKVRPKDFALLHPGPVRSLAELNRGTLPAGEVHTAWEILSGSTTTVRELAELAFGAYTPVTAWATWQLVAEGIYFRGTPDEVIACTGQEVEEKLAARAAEAAERRAWEAFLARARVGAFAAEDERYLREIENLALGRSERSRVLRALGHEETPENAHAVLLELGRWDYTVNPYPQRLGLSLSPPAMGTPEWWRAAARRISDEPRLDLTHLPAFAIDDEGTDIPDDALTFLPGAGAGWDGARLWVHVADPAAIVFPGDELDLEARARGATLYLPEGAVPMLPPEATPLLGLGLSEVSPALSFGLDLDAGARIGGLEVVPSWIRVTRLTYDQVEAHLDDEPFGALYRLAQTYEARRRENGAIAIELPEVAITVRGRDIAIQPIPPLRSRTLVENAMIMAGEAVAGFALEHDIPLPYATQDPPEPRPDAREAPDSSTLAGMYVVRRTLKRSQYRSLPAPHSGLGLPAYTQVTSPMRRYLDLVVHQQLRAYAGGTAASEASPGFPRARSLLSAQEILERVGAIEAVIGSLRQAEQLSDRHWTLAHLLQNPKWRGTGVLVDRRGLNGTVLIADLALENPVHLPAALDLNAQLTLSLRGVDLPHRDARFRVEGA